MTFAQVTPTPSLPEMEAELLARWAEEDLFQKSLELRKSEPLWVFYEGPPTANGRPGIHHIWARVFKDLYPRFWTMRGRYVPRRGGWDCHGLPVEIEVERELGLKSKDQILAYGIEAFNQKCKESVQRYVDEWERLTKRIGMWLDMDDAYWTMSNEFIESVWWIFSEIWKKGLIYEGSKVVPYCGRCGTALSSHEVAQGYEDITEDSIYVRFALKDKPLDLLAWTTTPWTLISNVGLAVGDHLDYVEVKDPQGSGRNLVMAKSRVEAVLGEEAEVVGAVSVKDLEGLYYDPPFRYLVPEGDAYRVVNADFVSAGEGSGVVHMASAFGEIDRLVCEREGLAVLNPVNAEGRFEDLVGSHAGQFVIDANPELVVELGQAVVKVEKYAHSYPHCWRCDTPLIYWSKPTWFARTSEKRSELQSENLKVGWHPGHIKEGRFGTWLAENVDWALSRDRFWGTPIPVWICSDCQEPICVESLSQLSDLAVKDAAGLDLHRPYIDEVELVCPQPKCGGTARRVDSVLDAWFDSGSMPLAQLHHPFRSDSKELKQNYFPADFICEAIDQTRGWFYSLLAVNTLALGESPYKNVVCLAHILDKDGLKMSKSRGNVIDPWPPIEELGADALRWYFLSEGLPWTPRRISIEAIGLSTRQTLLTLWNVYSFFVTYANIDGFEPGSTDSAQAKHVLDRWLLSRLADTVNRTTSALEDFDAFEGAKTIQLFVDDMSNWYVRRSRARFWKGEDPMAYAVLHKALVTLTRLLAPFCPFISDVIHRNLNGGLADGESVHLSDWPDSEVVDADLEQEMEIVRKLATLGRATRTSAGIKVRKPLKRALVVFPGGQDLRSEVLAELAEELNVKSVEIAADSEGLFVYEVRPNFKTLGPKLGKKMSQAAEAVKQLDRAALKTRFDANEPYVLTLDGEALDLFEEDVVISATSHERLAVSEEGGFTIALDLELTQELLDEGLAREMIRLVNEHRKESGLEVSDRIKMEVRAKGWVLGALKTHAHKISEEVLATEISILDSEPQGTMVEAVTDEGDKVGVTIERQ